MRPTPNTIVDNRALALEQIVNLVRPLLGLDNFGPADDRLLARLLNTTQEIAPPGLSLGKVHTALPYLNSYLVAIEGSGLVRCGALAGNSSASILGPRLHQTIPADTDVLVWLHPSMTWGYIVGTLPVLVEDGNYTASDYISQGGGAGLKKSPHYIEYLRQLGKNSGAIDFSNQAPLDQLPGDYSILTEFGSGLHIDPQQVFFRINEICGIFGYKIDQLLKIMAFNYDFHSSVWEERHRVDLLETTLERGSSPYLWEALGHYRFQLESIAQEMSDQDVQLERPVGKLEPQHPDLVPFRRYQEFGGYLGNGVQRRIVLPPADGQLHRESQETVLPGAFLEHIDLNGAYLLRSAKSISLEKYCLIPTPKRIRPAEDYSEQGDSREQGNYNHAGIADPNLDPHYSRDVAHSEPQHRLLKSAVAAHDTAAYQGDWRAVTNFYYHGGDFYIPEESDQPASVAQTAVPLEALQTKSYIDHEDWGEDFAQSQSVDHRNDRDEEGVQYFANRAGIFLTDDGAVVIRGGCGEEIRLAGGEISLSAPGDVKLHAGRNVVSLGGYDVILKANRSLEQTANQGDVLIKAEKNLQTISGNSGTGSTLLENRATHRRQEYPSEGGDAIEASGVVVKTPHSDFATISRNVYLRTGNQEGEIDEGDIILDAAQGKREIRTISSRMVQQVDSRVEFVFGTPNVRSVSFVSQQGVQVSGGIRATEGLYSLGDVQAIGNVTSLQGHFSSAQGGDVGQLQNASSFVSALRQGVTQGLRTVRTEAASAKQAFDKDWYGPGQIGNEENQQAISFSYRTSQQLGTEQFVLPQAYWQILCDNSSAVEPWEERPVYYQKTEELRMAYPGKEAWENPQSFLTFPADSHRFYDLERGRAQERQPQEDPQQGPFVPRALQGNYKILKRSE